ncbi:MAG: DUF3641 domain-containing protein, partial [Acidiferrobacterales bacterium]
DFGIRFNRLLTLANLPINRFAHYLDRTGQRESYEQLLIDNFNPETVPGLMCRHLLSVDWLGRVYDCDFNQMLDIPLGAKPHRYLWDIDVNSLENGRIGVGTHCFGCTAGSGSSCAVPNLFDLLLETRYLVPAGKGRSASTLYRCRRSGSYS